MNNQTYRWIGLFIIIFTFLLIATTLIPKVMDMRAITRGYAQLDYVYDVVVKGIFPSIVCFILGFFPGLFYYKFGKEKKHESILIKWAGIMHLIALILFGLYILNFIYINYLIREDTLALIGPAFLFAVPALVIYLIGVVLLVINKFKRYNRNL